MSRSCLYIIIALGILFPSCSGVKKLTKPQTPAPATFSSISAENDSTCLADIDWWEFYSDPTLRDFIGRTLKNNKDLLAAGYKLEHMNRLYGSERANILPVIGGTVYANDETNDYSGTGIIHDREIGVKIPISWEINLMGSQIWNSRRAAAEYQASAEDLRAMQVLLIARTAEAYFRLLALENEVAIVNHTMESRKESLRMAKIRYDGGLTSETVYQQAMVEYSTAASLVPNLRQGLNSARNELTLLMGELPQDSLTPYLKRLEPIMLDRIPTGVPSDLLQRRPDIRASARRLEAATANCGATYANRFPSLQLGFTPGLENNELTKFLQSPFTFIVGTISGPIFDFGRRKRKYQAAVAAYEQARLNYEKTVLQAFTEVNSAINAYDNARKSRKLKLTLCEAAEKYVHLARLQYNAGRLNYIDVLDAQRRYFDARIAVSNTIRNEYFALIDLYKALGGGWSLPKN